MANLQLEAINISENDFMTLLNYSSIEQIHIY